MSTPEGPDQPWQQQEPPPDTENIYLQPPNTGQLPPPYDGQQYGGQYGGQQYGYPLTAPPQRPSSRVPLIVAAAAVVAFAVGAVVVVAVNKNDDKSTRAQTPPPTSAVSSPLSASTPSPVRSTPQSTPPSSPSGGSSPTSVQQIRVAPVISGWQGVLSYKENVAYDVPPDWKIETPGTLVGFEDKNGTPVAIMHGVSTYRDEACPKVSGSYRGHTGFETAGGVAPATAARGGLKIFADGVALNDDGSSASISGTTEKTIKVDRGKISATYARATVAVKDKSACGRPSVVVVAVAFRTGPKSTALFIGYFDQGVPDALPLTTVEKIFTTLRPYSR